MSTQLKIIRELGVKPVIDVNDEIERRVSFLANYLKDSNCQAYVLGISGGIDSATAGRLAQVAVNRLRNEGYDVEFIAVRLPYGIQRDEADAQASLNFIKPDRVEIVNIKTASDEMLKHSWFGGNDVVKQDFVLGNIKARQRMVAQYAIAGQFNGLVIGTDHAAEAVMGFFTKFGDGACDITPLSGLNKRQVRSVAQALGAPVELVNKIPTADLEDLNPGKPDEVAYGVTYDQIDDFLEGKKIDKKAKEKILKQHSITQHKRALPIVPE
jgi:NAD+ synthase